MTDITLNLRSVKGSPLSSAEVDSNFTQIKNDLGQKLYITDYTGDVILTKLKDFDGIGSGLDADRVDGMDALSTIPTTTDKSSIVSRNASGNFIANVITASLVGDVTGDIYASNGSTKILDNGSGSNALLTGNVIGNVTGDVIGDLTGDVTGNVTGNLIGDIYSADGSVKILENGSNTGAGALFIGSVQGNVTGNVSGNAGTVTNGVYTTGSYPNPTWLTSLAGTKVTSIPNSSLVYPYVTINSTNLALGESLNLSINDLTGILQIERGGTGAENEIKARANLNCLKRPYTAGIVVKRNISDGVATYAPSIVYTLGRRVKHEDRIYEVVVEGTSGIDLESGDSYPYFTDRRWRRRHGSLYLVYVGTVGGTGDDDVVTRQLAVSGTGLSLTNATGINGNMTITLTSVSTNTPSSVVARDASGNFSAGTITATINGTVTNGVVTTGSYANPAWITSLSGAKLTSASVPNSALVNSGIIINGDNIPLGGSVTVPTSTGFGIGQTYVTYTSPTRLLDTDYTNSTSNLIWVSVTAKSSTYAGEAGETQEFNQLKALVGSPNATTVVALDREWIASGSKGGMQVGFFVPAGHKYRIAFEHYESEGGSDNAEVSGLVMNWAELR
jgi:hypothetical protein